LIKASELGANALAVFLKNQRRWESKPMEEESVQKFRKFMLEKSLGGGSSAIFQSFTRG
jgi:endonuclease IV